MRDTGIEQLMPASAAAARADTRSDVLLTKDRMLLLLLLLLLANGKLRYVDRQRAHHPINVAVSWLRA